MTGIQTEPPKIVPPPQNQNGGNGSAQHGQPQHDSHGEGEIPKDLPRPSTLTVIIVLVVAIVLLAALFVIGLVPYEHAKSQIRADASQHSKNLPIVRLAEPKQSINSQDLSFPCEVRANQSTDLFPRSNGFLKKLYVDIQDQVKQNQLLADIDTPDVDAQLAQGKANLAQSQANVVKAQSDLDLAQKTLDRFLATQKASPGSVSQQDIDQNKSSVQDAQSALEQSKATVKAGEANVQELTVLLGFNKVYAPFSGTITARNYDVGALLSPTTGAGKQLFSIAQTDPLRVFVNVPQNDSTQIQANQPAYLTVANYPGKEFQGAVARTSGSLDATTRTLLVEIHFPNHDGQLLVGMYGQVRLEIRSSHTTLVIPSSALIFNADGLKVATVKDNKIHLATIQVGRDLGTELEVVTGLNATDHVVANPGERLAEGIEVQVPPPAEANAAK